MKNLLKLREDKLEVLPNRSNFRFPDDGHDRWRGMDYPRRKIERFFETHVGRNWDEVYSKFCKMEWLPKQYRNMETVRNHVFVDTFIKDGKVCFIEKYGSGEKTIESAFYKRDILYIHPTTKVLCVYRGKHVSYKKKREVETSKTMKILGDYHQLLKLDGIWCEVKGEVVPSDIVKIDGLHYRLTKLKVVKKFYVHGGIFTEAVEFPPGSRTDGKYKIIDGKVYVPEPLSHWYDDKHKPPGPRDRMIEDKVSRPVWTWRNIDRDKLKITLCKQLNHKQLKYHGLKNDVKIDGPRCKKCGGISGKDCLYHMCPKCGKYLKEDCKCNQW